MNNLRPNEYMQMNEMNYYYNLPPIDIQNMLMEKQTDENFFLLLLSVYFYLKHNNYHTTAEILFKEANLSKIFCFPQDLGEPKNELEKLKKTFVNYFYFNTFFQQSDTSDFLADHWNQFWEIFVEKIRQSNQTASTIDQFVKDNKLQLTCKIYLFNSYR
jgi:hypothetical protein